MQFQAGYPGAFGPQAHDPGDHRPGMRLSGGPRHRDLAGYREEIQHLWVCDTTYEPKMEAPRREALLGDWHRAVERSRGWAK